MEHQVEDFFTEDSAGEAPALITPVGIAPVRVEPGDVLIGIERDFCERGMALTEADDLARETENLFMLLQEPPVVPGDLIVLAERIIVPLLGAAEFVASKKSGTPLETKSVAIMFLI